MKKIKECLAFVGQVVVFVFVIAILLPTVVVLALKWVDFFSRLVS